MAKICLMAILGAYRSLATLNTSQRESRASRQYAPNLILVAKYPLTASEAKPDA
jgi:hypothetical protein